MNDELEEQKRSSETPARPGDPARDSPPDLDASNDPLPKPGVDASDTYSSSSDPYGYSPSSSPESPAAEATSTLDPEPGTALETAKVSPPVTPQRTPPKPPPPPPPDEDEEEDEEEEGMLRMSFMGHLEELRARILKALAGLVIAFLLSMFFTKELWRVVSEPARAA